MQLFYLFGENIFLTRSVKDFLSLGYVCKISSGKGPATDLVTRLGICGRGSRTGFLGVEKGEECAEEKDELEL